MNNLISSSKKLWFTLLALALAIALVIVIDLLPVSPSGTTTDLSDNTEHTMEDTKTVSLSGDGNTFTITFLGECAPGSPYGTGAYGSLNAHANEKGVSYFFAEIADFLAGDNLTVATNRCVFSDLVTAECAAPLANASLYADASVDLVLNLAPELDPYTVQAALPLQNTGVSVIKNDTALSYRVMEDSLRLTILTARATQDSAADLIQSVTDAASSAEYLILYFYGGEINSHVTEDWLTETMHACVDAGADLIVGTGTGVLRPTEIYNGVSIAYSLGALIDGTQLMPENAAVLMRCTIEKNNDMITTDVSYIPLYAYTELWQPSVMPNGEDAALVFDFLSGKTAMPIETQPN